jgi:hypothetical protein
MASAMLAAALALVATPVLAQQGGPGMMGGACPMMDMMGQGMGQGGMGMGSMGMDQGGMGQGGMGQGMMGGQMTAMTEARLAYLHAALAITAAQETAWQDYAAAVREQVGAMQQNHATLWEAMHAGTAPDRMAARITAMSAMLAALQALQPATAALYAGLDETQQALADQLIGMDCGAF